MLLILHYSIRLLLLILVMVAFVSSAAAKLRICEKGLFLS